MCGIAGIIRTADTTRDDVAAVERMMGAQTHRGPDGSGIYSNLHAVFGHRRLSIIDLSAAGRQPMSNEDGTIWVTYNGEIYNYKELRSELLAAGHVFRSDCDTEVLLHGYEQWGLENLLRRLRGMFAFGLYDCRHGLTILARDRLGIKPLYYYAADGTLAFASEVRALLRSAIVPDEADPEALPGFLLFGSVPSPLTTVKAVHCLLPGHYLLAKQGSIAVQQYWDLRSVDAKSAPEEDGGCATERTRAHLQRAVSEHLISDVPLGVFLSGGVDSAAIVALAAHMRSKPLTTLTVAFGEQGFDESQEALHIAHEFETHHHEILVNSDDFAREMPAFLAHMDQPTNDGINTWFVSKAARQCDLSVVLSGLGGDEVFWGYGHYRRVAEGAPMRRVLDALPAFARRGLIDAASVYGSIRGEEKWMRLSALRNTVSAEAMYYGFRGFFPPRQASRLLGLSSREIERTMEGALTRMRTPGANGHFRASGLNFIEMKRYLHDQLLRDTDAFSMAHSIEVRVPLLDHELVEHCASLPDAAKLDGAMNKPALVRAVADSVVTAASGRTKKGFTFPMDRWMKAQSGPLGEMARSSPELEKREAATMWTAFEKGRLHWSRAWAMVVLGARS
jgi:asparagine synthase (glutamine-hydrolysing)